MNDDEKAAASVNLILATNEFWHGRSDLSEEAVVELNRMAAALIPDFVHNLNAWTKSQGSEGRGPGGNVHGTGFGANQPQNFGRNVGRNEPCLCGWDRKYKLCREAVSNLPRLQDRHRPGWSGA